MESNGYPFSSAQTIRLFAKPGTPFLPPKKMLKKMKHSQFSKLQTFKKISKHEKKPSMIAAPGGGIITWAIRRAFLPMTNVWLDV